MKVAVVQMSSGACKEENLKRACYLVQKAAKQSARFIMLPEVFNYRGKEGDPESTQGESIKALKEMARKYNVFILAGSICEKITRSKKMYNTSVLIDNKGKTKAIYRKINLFDAKIGNQSICESKRFSSGKKMVVVDVFGFKIGLSICYDLRFSEIYKYYAQRGVDIICVPAAFTQKTGKAHWETLLRARAIETLSYVLAPNQAGSDGCGVKSYGHSMIIDPWGKVLGNAKDAREKIVYTEIKKSKIKKVRKVLTGFNK